MPREGLDLPGLVARQDGELEVRGLTPGYQQHAWWVARGEVEVRGLVEAEDLVVGSPDADGEEELGDVGCGSQVAGEGSDAGPVSEAREVNFVWF